jgi:hypothetical protein
LRDLIAVAQENSLELTAGHSAIESTRKDLRLFRGIDMRPSGQRWRNFFPAHGLRKFRMQLCINVSPIEWTQQKNGS